MERKKGLKDITNEEAIAHLDTLVCRTFARGMPKNIHCTSNVIYEFHRDIKKILVALVVPPLAMTEVWTLWTAGTPRWTEWTG